ncbi:MAG: SDR family oxidoreductase [Phreatobacter sp.]|uniref:SDR family NAD(P)-dependent oxidoreductase n=1 Tax=Phreatobacter sp. TaxID=1966341 RepID=UPI00273423D8|nr:SDR family oxidoreductase [Phreatobacter sp.]MDP2800531.1 SDR family oxidoreductase [Phreatobacter sp.]
MATSNTASTQWRDRYGPWAVVTGASDGIGLEIARDLAARGLKLVLVARRAAVLEQIADVIERTNSVETRVIAADLGKSDDVERVLRECQDLDVGLLVASAGFGTTGNFLATDIRDEVDMVDVNCRAVLAMSKHFSARFAARKKGGLILFGSIVGYQGVGNAANYAATKAYVQTLAEGLAVDLAPSGIDVLSCAPGPVETGFAVRSNLSSAQSADPRAVARETVAALGRMTTVKPGIMSKILINSLAFLPRRARTKILSGIMASRTKHHHGSEAQRTPQQPA